MVKVVLYFIFLILSIWSLDSLNIEGKFKKNKYYQARCLYLLISFCISYLSVNFIYDIFLNSRFI